MLTVGIGLDSIGTELTSSQQKGSIFVPTLSRKVAIHATPITDLPAVIYLESPPLDLQPATLFPSVCGFMAAVSADCAISITWLNVRLGSV